MTDAPSGRSMGNISMRRGLKLVLAAQVVIAILLLISDVDAHWLPDVSPDDALPHGPVHPGDQVRRYDPSLTRPSFTNPGAMPGFDVPEDLPQHLKFAVHDAGEAGEVLLLHGPIKPGDAQRFEAYLASLGDLAMPVALNSPGGVVDEALAIGRLLRERAAATEILPGMACLSSCPYILAGGTERRVSRRGAVGLHQHYYETPGLLPVFVAVESIQRGQGRTMEYLIEMGVDPGVMVNALQTPPDEIYVLVAEELLDAALATDVTD